MTPSGHQRLQDELMHLWHDERPRVVQEVADAAALGDRSENAEYIYGKRRLREIDRRMRVLNTILEETEVIDPSTVQADDVQFGATVEVEDEDGGFRQYQIVGEHEVDAKLGRVSMASPMGRALLKARVDDEVVVRRPAGELVLTVRAVRYV